MKNGMERLAIHGGPKVRVDPPPYREAMGPDERAAVTRVLEHYERSRADPPYEGHFQHEFERDFAVGMGVASTHPFGEGPFKSESIMFPTKELAEQKAKQMGCNGAHAMGGEWMPCASMDEYGNTHTKTKHKHH